MCGGKQTGKGSERAGRGARVCGTRPLLLTRVRVPTLGLVAVAPSWQRGPCRLIKVVPAHPGSHTLLRKTQLAVAGFEAGGKPRIVGAF